MKSRLPPFMAFYLCWNMGGFQVPIFCICKGADYGLGNKGQRVFYIPNKLPRGELKNKDSTGRP